MIWWAKGSPLALVLLLPSWISCHHNKQSIKKRETLEEWVLKLPLSGCFHVPFFVCFGRSYDSSFIRSVCHHTSECWWIVPERLQAAAPPTPRRRLPLPPPEIRWSSHKTITVPFEAAPPSVAQECITAFTALPNKSRWGVGGNMVLWLAPKGTLVSFLPKAVAPPPPLLHHGDE